MAKVPKATKIDLGKGLWFEIVRIDSLREQDVNAQVMEQARYARLTENVRQTGYLESVPYCAQPNGKGPVEIVSGHHRARAAKAAGMKTIPVLIDRNGLTRSQITAKQLAHNALIGTTDSDVIKTLIERIKGADDMLASGVDASLLPGPEKQELQLLIPHVDYKWTTCTFAFLDHQMANFEALCESLKETRPQVIALCDAKDQDSFMHAIAEYAREKKILNASTVVAKLTEIALRETKKGQ